MGHIIQVLIIIGIIVFAIVKRIARSSEEEREERQRQQPRRSMPMEEDEPFLSYDYDPIVENKPSAPKPKATEQPPSESPPIQDATDSNPDFNIHSTEEARRAIIWSEILNRKY